MKDFHTLPEVRAIFAVVAFSIINLVLFFYFPSTWSWLLSSYMWIPFVLVSVYIIRTIRRGRMVHASEEVDLSGKVAFITGANTGIGFETAKALVRMGCHVIVGCRDLNNGESTVRLIHSQLDSKVTGKAEFIAPLELTKFDSISNFVSKFKETNLPLHILINNAGYFPSEFSMTADGLETATQANHVGHFLLTVSLLPVIIRSKGRVVNVASWAQHFSTQPATVDVLLHPRKENFSPFNLYGNTKLANILFSSELTKRRGVPSYSLHPGSIATDLQRQSMVATLAGKALALLILKVPVEGAQTSLYCSIVPDLKSGYYTECIPAYVTPSARDQQLAADLWDETDKIVRKFYN